jgi:hypothetical protein
MADPARNAGTKFMVKTTIGKLSMTRNREQAEAIWRYLNTIGIFRTNIMHAHYDVIKIVDGIAAIIGDDEANCSANESYPSNWQHCAIHLNPETGEMHSDGDHRVREWIEHNINQGLKDDWIRVEDRLPEESEHKPILTSVIQWPGIEAVRIGRWSSKAGFMHRGESVSKVIAWQPLPEPAKG